MKFYHPSAAHCRRCATRLRPTRRKRHRSMKHAWSLAARNLRRNRRRNVATGLAIAIGFASLVVLGGYVARIARYLETTTVYLQHLGHVSVFARGGLEMHLIEPQKFNLTLEQQGEIRSALAADPQVEFFGRTLRGAGLVGNGCKTYSFFGFGVDLDLDRHVRHHPAVAARAAELAKPVRGVALVEASEPGEAVALAEGLSNRIGKTRVLAQTGTRTVTIEDCAADDVRDQIAEDANVQLAGATFDGSFSAVDGNVVGIFSTGLASSDDVTLWSSLEHLQTLYDTDQVTSFAIYLRDPSQSQRYAKALQKSLAEKKLDVDVLTYEDEDLNPYFVGTVRFLTIIAAFISSVVVFVVTLSVVNSTTMTIFERSREIGTLRSLGFTRKQIIGLFMREGALLSAISLGAGLLLALGIAASINSLDIQIQPPGLARAIRFVVTPSAPITSLLALATIGVGALATLVATRGVAQENIARLNAEVTK